MRVCAHMAYMSLSVFYCFPLLGLVFISFRREVGYDRRVKEKTIPQAKGIKDQKPSKSIGTVGTVANPLA